MRLAVLEGNGAQTTTIVRSERSSFADFEISPTQFAAGSSPSIPT
jgi:hypothetical protein